MLCQIGKKRNVPENIYACSLVLQLLKKQSSLLLNRLVVDVSEQKGYCVTRINFLKQGITQNDQVQTTLFMLLSAILVFKDRGSHSSISCLALQLFVQRNTHSTPTVGTFIANDWSNNMPYLPNFKTKFESTMLSVTIEHTK